MCLSLLCPSFQDSAMDQDRPYLWKRFVAAEFCGTMWNIVIPEQPSLEGKELNWVSGILCVWVDRVRIDFSGTSKSIPQLPVLTGWSVSTRCLHHFCLFLDSHLSMQSPSNPHRIYAFGVLPSEAAHVRQSWWPIVSVRSMLQNRNKHEQDIPEAIWQETQTETEEERERK